MGKYDEVVLNLSKIPTARSERVVALMKKDEGLDATKLARLYASIRKERSDAEAVLSKVNERVEAISALLVGAYEAEGVSLVKVLETGQSVGVEKAPYATVEDREVFRTWCIENGYERELKLAWQTTNAVTKERLLQGLPEPDGVKAYVMDKLVLRKK